MNGVPANRQHMVTRAATGPAWPGGLPEEIQDTIVALLTPLEMSRVSAVNRSLSKLVGRARQWEILLGGAGEKDTMQRPRLAAGARIAGAICGRESRAVVQTRLDSLSPPSLSVLLSSDELFEAQLIDWQHQESRLGRQSAALAASQILQARASAAPSLDLGGLHFSTLPPCIGGLKQLEKLHLGGCSALTVLPETMGQLTKLHTLHLHGCTSLASLPEAMSQLYRLRILYLSGCTALAALPSALRELPQLETLNTLGCTSLVTPMDAIKQHGQWLDLLNLESPQAPPEISVGDEQQAGL